MKNINFKSMLMAVACVLMVGLCTKAMAGSAAWDYCEADSNKKGYATYSLLNVINEFNNPSPEKFCAKHAVVKITDKTKEIYLDQGILLSGSGYGINDPFLLEAVDSGDKIILKATDDADLSRFPNGCLVTIQGNYINMKNFMIANSPGDGICISGSNISLEKMEIRDNKGVGIRLLGSGSNAVGFKVSDTTVYNNQGSGLSIDAGAGALSDVLGTEMNFFQNNVAEGKMFDAGSMVGSSNPVYVKLTLNRSVGDKFTVHGYVRKADTCDAAVDDSVETLYIHRADQQTTASGVSGKTFLGSINFAKQSTGSSASTGGVVYKVGYFTWDYTGDASQIFFIPKLAGSKFGSSSRIYTLSQGTSGGDVDCGGGNVPSGGEGVSGIKNIKGFATKSECYSYNPLHGVADQGVSAPIDFDSDNDGISDYREDVNNNCECDVGELCWYRADTDFDGIKDKTEDPDADGTDCADAQGNKVDPADKASVYGDDDVTLLSSFKPGTRVPAACVKEVIAGKPVFNVGYSSLETNATLQYSDEDGLTDGEETRSRGFNRKAETYLYTENETTFFKPDDQKHGCEISPDASLAGIDYGVWKISADGNTMSNVTGQPNVIASEGDYFMFLVCKNPSIRVGRDFVGVQWNAKWGMTNPLVADTDDDKFNDDIDQCPNKKDVTSASCTPDCVDFEIFNYIPEKYVTENHEGLTLEDGKPLIFTIPLNEVQGELCGEGNCDVDGDGILDVFENPTGKCNAAGYSSPYSKDTDGDNVDDNKDICPDVPGVGVSGGCKSDTDIQFVYQKRAYLACFIDRDGDGLYDCQEDLNLNGSYDKGSELATTDPFGLIHPFGESDASKKDTDGELGDYLEVVNLKTNPGVLDTDGDKSSDLYEVSMDDDNGSYTPPSLGSHIAKEGSCWSTHKDIGDTDPTKDDTDGDTILDGQEIKNKTNPNNIDSDNDQLNDDKEDKNKNGIWPKYEGTNIADGGNIEDSDYSDTNPCDANTDHQGLDDKQEMDVGTCPGNPNPACKYNPENFTYGFDTDSDGIPDGLETKFRTDKNNDDTDGDGLLDGCDSSGKGELCWHVETENWDAPVQLVEGTESDPAACEPDDAEMDAYVAIKVKGALIYFDANYVGNRAEGVSSFCGVQVAKACGADSDGDGMPDAVEYAYGTFPGQADSDQDGIIDGIETKWLVAEVVNVEQQLYKLKVGNGVNSYTGGSSIGFGVVTSTTTDAMNADSDGDMLVDGFQSMTNFEDKDCNGKVGVNMQGAPYESDPRNARSSGSDQPTDGEKLCRDGNCSVSHVYERRAGCSVGGTGGETWGMTLMFAIMLAATRVAVFVMRKTKKAKRRA